MQISFGSKPDYVIFLAYPGFFILKYSYCSNPDCPDNHLFLHFAECNIKFKPVKSGLAFCIHLDLDTGKEINPPERPPALRKIAEEFARDQTDDMLNTFREKAKRDRAYNKRLNEYIIDTRDIEEGNLIAFTDIVEEKGSIAYGGSACAFIFSHGGYDYYVDDLYCPQPDCKCNNVHLAFSEKRTNTGGEIEIRPIFIGMTDFKGEKSIEKLYDCSRSKAEALLAELFRLYPSLLKQVKESYRTVRKIAARSVTKGKRSRAERGTALDNLPATRRREQQSAIVEEKKNDSQNSILGDLQKSGMSSSAVMNVKKVGRNEPCPCGSGKKYKKCCGR